MKFKLVLFLLLLICFLPPSPARAQETPEPCETRGTWLTPESFDTPAQRADTLYKLTHANINTIFIAAPSIGRNYGWTDSNDFLLFIQEAKSRGMAVHVWIANMFRQGEGKQAAFTRSSEQTAQARWTLSLMKRYGAYLDGVHFDYIRYRQWQPIRPHSKMDGVTQTVMKSYRLLKSRYPDKFLSAAVFTADPTWEEEYRDTDPPLWIEDVPQWFRDWYAANPGNIYENASNEYDENFVGVPDYMKYGQNPVEWLHNYGTGESIMDTVMPMMYVNDNAEWNQELDTWISFMEFIGEDPTHVAMGLGWLEDLDDPSCCFDAAKTVDKINYGRSKGITGFVIFQIGGRWAKTYDPIDDTPLIDALANGPYASAVPSCMTSPALATYPLKPLAGTSIRGLPTMKWTSSAGATQWEFQIDDDSDFGSLDYSTIVGARVLRLPVQLAGNYFWRVRAGDQESTWGEWSEMRRIAIRPPIPHPPTLLTPSNRIKLPNNSPTFTWSTPVNAARYRIQIDRHRNFKSPDTNTLAILPNYTSTGLSDGAYYWRVQALNASGEISRWSKVRKFIIGATP